ncbi:MAG: polysulfide reductase NrfD [Deltaproteobacteria bacterium]|nr:polysulfide reductase NrfD [Deltaproteobacteria bacterium]MBW2620335.1 polysulfide reductase NrfD [Deltaproteobacteria bacterium]MBW2642346.1 polysulfide reductase NrfD [Deltaproteobacteria bacterium]
MATRTKKHLDIIFNRIERTQSFYVWVSILVAVSGLALYAILMSLIYSLEIFEFSAQVIWATMVSNYVFLVVSSTGLCIVTSLGHVFGMQRYELIGRRGVFLALITIIFGMISIGAHLGHPERAMIFNLLTPNFLSAMWWMGTLYSFYIVFIAIEYWLLARPELIERSDQAQGPEKIIYGIMAFRQLDRLKIGPVLKNHKLLQFIGAAALISGLSAHNTLGALFGHIEARPLWHGSYYPIYFLLSASFCGYALLLAVSIASYKIKKEEIPEDYQSLIFEMAQVLALLLSAGLLFTAYKMGFGLFTPEKVKPIMLFLKGPFSQAFWLFEIAIGTVLPIPILLWATKQKNIIGVLIASVMVLVGVYVMRYDFVVAAQVYPVIKNGLPSYLPAFMEVLFIGGVLGALFLTYVLGEKFLPLKEEHHH